MESRCNDFRQAKKEGWGKLSSITAATSSFSSLQQDAVIFKNNSRNCKKCGESHLRAKCKALSKQCYNSSGKNHYSSYAMHLARNQAETTETAKTTEAHETPIAGHLMMTEAADTGLTVTLGTDNTIATDDVPTALQDAATVPGHPPVPGVTVKEHLTRPLRLTELTSYPQSQVTKYKAAIKEIFFDTLNVSGSSRKVISQLSPRRHHRTVHNAQLLATRPSRATISVCKGRFRSRSLYHAPDNFCQAVPQGSLQWGPTSWKHHLIQRSM